MNFKSGFNKCSKHLVGKVVIVTGGSSGIGFETAKDFADRGAKVIIASNDEGQETSVRDIISATGNTNVYFKYLDLGSLSFVRKSIIILINVASMAYCYGKIDFEDLKGTKKKISMMKVYSNSKLCVVLMTVELARLLDGTGVTANCLHPGIVRTTILDSFVWSWLRNLSILKPVGKSPWEGAQTTIYLVVSPEVRSVSGRYFSECRQQNISATARDPVLSRKLWEVSEEVVNLK